MHTVSLAQKGSLALPGLLWVQLTCLSSLLPFGGPVLTWIHSLASAVGTENFQMISLEINYFMLVTQINSRLIGCDGEKTPQSNSDNVTYEKTEHQPKNIRNKKKMPEKVVHD